MRIRTHITSYRTISRSAEPNHGVGEQDKIRDRIRSFRDLSPRWHYGEGRGATEAAVDTALAVHHLFLNHRVKTIEVFPDVDGGILVSGYYEQHTFDVFCTPDGQMNLLHEVDDEEVTERDNLPMHELIDYLGGPLWGTKKLSDCSIPDIIALKGESLRELHSKTHQRAVCLFLTPSVLKSVAEQNASIYESFILNKQEALLSSGDCERLNSLKILAKNIRLRLQETTAT